MITIIPYFFAVLLPENGDLVADSIAIRKLELLEMQLKEHPYRRGRPVPARLFSFDPNHTTAAEWQLLGLSPKQAAVMIRYTAKGGRFRKKEDLRKMYMVTEEMFQRWNLYIKISPGDTLPYNKYAPYKFTKPKPVLAALNTADTLQLDSVKGIGPAFARRIVKYREALGGYYKKEQLLEIFQMDTARYNAVKDQLILDKTALRMIHVNKIERNDLKYHPYLKYNQINAIIQFRKQHGNYSNIAELKKVAILSPETVEKLAPYISFDHD
ncbi:MAG: helix-hairpin-helix domain-containing protein [Pedobacter sp.]|uniref:ComEA family DNA-binding protein n=1 Tax=Pedobacter sp. TaxID=1411316 RepID=UPI003398E93E